MQSASIEGKQNTPSNGPETSARNSCGTTMRRLASSCFSKVERNISPRPLLATGKPDRTHLAAADPPLAPRLTMDNGLTWDELGYNDSERPNGLKSGPCERAAVNEIHASAERRGNCGGRPTPRCQPIP